MGLPMATRLSTAGYCLSVWNRTTSKTRSLAQLGATIELTPLDVARNSQIVITMLEGPEALDQVVFGDMGISRAMSSDKYLIDMSTTGPKYWLELVDRLDPHGGSGPYLVDAPVLGSVPQAQAGELAIFVGANLNTYSEVQDLLGTLGEVTRVGGPGAGQSLKLVINSSLVSLQCVLGEALALAGHFGLDTTMVLDALERSSLEPVVRKKRHNIQSNDFSARFSARNAHKDARLIIENSTSKRDTLKIVESSLEYFRDAIESGDGDQDYSVVTKTIRARLSRGTTQLEQ